VSGSPGAGGNGRTSFLKDFTSTAFAGGGGGGGYLVNNAGGGAGGGGLGAGGSATLVGGNGSGGLGGGGGGGSLTNSGSYAGGSGGGGIVHIAYLGTSTKASGGTVTTSTFGGITYQIHTYSSSGTFTVNN
jgi:hypothetical protein